jgi:CHASE2 domain-containing sensor protein
MIFRNLWLLAVAGVALLAGLAGYSTTILDALERPSVHQRFTILDALERQSVDQRFSLRGVREPHSAIVIVDLDQRSLAALNQRPPIQRRLYGELLDKLAAASPRLIALDVEFIGASDPVDDKALLDAIKRHGPIVLATHDGPEGPVPTPAGRKSAAGAVLASTAVDVDRDSVLRRIIYIPVKTPTFAVRAAEMWTGEKVPESNFPDNHAWIDFAGPPGTYRHYSFIDVLTGSVGARELAGKAVLVGITDPSQRDVWVTSASSIPMAGVEVQANSLATILEGFPLREASWGLMIVVLLLCAVGPSLFALRVAALSLLGIGFGLLVLYLLVAQIAFKGGIIVAVVPVVVTLVVATIGAATVDSLSEKRRRAQLEKTLASFPSDIEPVFFISYRRDQTSWPAQALKDGLEKRFGADSVFMDLESIHPGQDWARRIREAIESCNVVLVLMGPYWLGARDEQGGRRVDNPEDWVRREIAEALRAPDVTVVPILLDGAVMPKVDQLPKELAELPSRNAFSLSAGRWEDELNEMVESLRVGRLGEALRRPSRD